MIQIVLTKHGPVDLYQSYGSECRSAGYDATVPATN